MTSRYSELIFLLRSLRREYMKDHEFTTPIEELVRKIAEKGSPSARWLLRILLKEIDRLREKISHLEKQSML